MALNTKAEGTQLFEIDFTPKGTKEKITVSVYAKNRLGMPAITSSSTTSGENSMKSGMQT